MGVNSLCPTEKTTTTKTLEIDEAKSNSDGSALSLGVAIWLQTAAALCMAEKADARATNLTAGVASVGCFVCAGGGLAFLSAGALFLGRS